MTILRIYDPIECDANGVPLDWERCRTCKGRRKVGTTHGEYGGIRTYAPCTTCDGHGSLKAAALDALLRDARLCECGHRRDVHRQPDVCRWEVDRGEKCPCNSFRGVKAGPARCEDCGHLMSEGTWEGERKDDVWDRGEGFALNWIARCLRADPSWEPDVDSTHYSPCDEGCRHGEPVRFMANALGGMIKRDGNNIIAGKVPDLLHLQPQASWRIVDVRTLGWPHDLRPEKLVVLCLRCFAERNKS